MGSGRAGWEVVDRYCGLGRGWWVVEGYCGVSPCSLYTAVSMNEREPKAMLDNKATQTVHRQRERESPLPMALLGQMREERERNSIVGIKLSYHTDVVIQNTLCLIWF